MFTGFYFLIKLKKFNDIIQNNNILFMYENQENFLKKDEAQFSSPEEEIEFLRKEIERRDDITKNFGERIKKEDHINDVLREHLSKDRKDVLPKNYDIDYVSKKRLLANLEPKDSDEKVTELIGIMLDKGIHSAVSLIKDLKNKSLEDDFHRFLIDFLLGEHEKKLEKNLSRAEWKALNMKLYEIILPENDKAQEGKEAKNVKEFIHFMEKFYTSMLSISNDLNNKENNYYVLEIAKPNNSNEVSFYVAVLKDVADLFEKSLFALFPDVIIKYSVEDYNIFSNNGFQLAAYATQIKTPALSIRTYENMEGDPISLIMSSFTKLKKVGEAASFQIIVKPGGENFLKKYSTMLNDLKKGETLKRIVDKDSFVKDFLLNIKEMNKTKEQIEKDKNKPRKIEDEKAQKHIENKISSTILDTNLRIVVNADTLERAKSMLQEMASTFMQYTEVDGNSLQFKMLEGGKLNEDIHNFIYRL